MFTLSALGSYGVLADEGVPRDPVAAMVRLHNAANAGSSEALYALTDRFMHGHGVPKDEVLALKYAKLAADRLAMEIERVGFSLVTSCNVTSLSTEEHIIRSRRRERRNIPDDTCCVVMFLSYMLLHGHCHESLSWHLGLTSRSWLPQNPAPPPRAPMDLRERWMDARFVDSVGVSSSLHQIQFEEDLALRGHLDSQVGAERCGS